MCTAAAIHRRECFPGDTGRIRIQMKYADFAVFQASSYEKSISNMTVEYRDLAPANTEPVSRRFCLTGATGIAVTTALLGKSESPLLAALHDRRQQLGTSLIIDKGGQKAAASDSRVQVGLAHQATTECPISWVTTVE